MATCYQKHPFQIENEDRLTHINTKIFEIKKKIQLSEGQRKSHYEENEAEKLSNAQLIADLKREVGERLRELARARTAMGDEELRVNKYINQLCPVGNKTSDQIIYNLDLKVTEQRKALDLTRYERKKKRTRLKELEKEYEKLLIEQSRTDMNRIKNINPARKMDRKHDLNSRSDRFQQTSHLENEIHRVTVQWNEAELVKKKYSGIRHALTTDAVKFESSLSQLQDMLMKQKEELKKLEVVREEATWMRARANAALLAEQASAADAEQSRAQERAYFTQRFEERARELEKLEKKIFPPAVRVVVRQDSTGSSDLAAVPEEDQPGPMDMEEVFQKLMKVTGVSEAEQVYERMRAQRETARRLQYLQRATEEEKLELEKSQNGLMAELEAFKFAQFKDKDESEDQIEELKISIERETKQYQALQETLANTNTTLMQIKRSIYGLCKMLEGVGSPPLPPLPPLPPWTEEARDAAPLAEALRLRFAAADAAAADILLRYGETALAAAADAVAASGARSARSARTSDVAGLSARSTPRDAGHPPAVAVALTYRDLLQREPSKPPVSDEDEEIPSRALLKRQAQLIVDTKSRRKGFRPQYPRK